MNSAAKREKKELDYFTIEGSYGGSQDWCRDYMMKIGGCAALTACDSCIYFDLLARRRQKTRTPLYPFDAEHLTRRDYVRFTKIMKPYLRPRWRGIDRLDLYTGGFGRYLSDCGCSDLEMEPLPGGCSAAEAAAALRRQIDHALPVPMLMLHHRDPEFSFYEWHWFLLTGCAFEADGRLLVKAATYGSWRWLDWRRFWETGYDERGGLVLYRFE